MKKALLFTMAMAIMLALAACGGGSAQSDPDADAATTPGGAAANLNSTDAELIYGTATLTYAEFYAGDVSSTDSFDAISSATNSKYQTMPNMASDFVDEVTNADGYHITGVHNVNLAVSADDYDAFLAVNPTFVRSEGDAPAQYKVVTMDNGNAVYSATQFNIADTVTDATAELVTGGTWGDYQINVYDGATIHLRNSRDDAFDINSQIQGIILETASGLKVGMEHLQSIWVQPFEVSFNVPEDNTHNTHIVGFDNLPELGKLVGESVTKITYIMPDSAYVYEFDGIYIKPIFNGSVGASASADYDAITLFSSDFGAFENGVLTVTYTLGSGRSREVTPLLATSLENADTYTYTLDVSALANVESGGVYSAIISSNTYADVTVALPVSDDQVAALNRILATAQEKLAGEPDNATLAEHIGEAEELLADENASSAEVGSLIAELTELTAEPEAEGEGGHGGGGNHES